MLNPLPSFCWRTYAGTLSYVVGVCSTCLEFGFLEWRVSVICSVSSPDIIGRWNIWQSVSTQMTELEGVMFFPDVSRYKRQRFYFYTFIFLKNNMQVHVWNVWICLYMLFVTFKVIKNILFCLCLWRNLESIAGCTFNYCLAYLEIWIGSVGPQFKHRYLENTRACNIFFFYVYFYFLWFVYNATQLVKWWREIPHL